MTTPWFLNGMENIYIAKITTKYATMKGYIGTVSMIMAVFKSVWNKLNDSRCEF